MRCKYCGNELPAGAKFCNKCGSPASSENEPIVGYGHASGNVTRGKTSGNSLELKELLNNKGVLTAVVILFLAVVIIILAVTHSQNQSDYSTNETTEINTIEPADLISNKSAGDSQPQEVEENDNNYSSGNNYSNTSEKAVNDPNRYYDDNGELPMDVVTDYIHDFENAINYQDYYYIEDYIKSGSPLHEMQSKYVQNIDVAESLVTYAIDDTVYSSNTSCVVTTTETYDVYHSDGQIKTVTQHCRYDVEKVNGKWLMTNLKLI